MSAREVIDRYYALANAGDWDRWCDLFTEDVRIDEQLAGRVDGRATLREMMAGFPAMYATFTNTPREVVIEGLRACVVSRLEATTPGGDKIAADVANLFLLDGTDRIAYMANFHDTAPFAPVTGG
ncbi:hypothetical protein GCM10027059_13930 [Myceligenerans halotolerans]